MTRSPSASLLFKGLATKYATVKWTVKTTIIIFYGKSYFKVLLQAQTEMLWAIKAHHHAETYFKVSGFTV